MGSGGPDGWRTILYINEENPFDFSGTGSDSGVLTHTNFYNTTGAGLVTPFVAEPLDDDPLTGDDYIVRAIGTTRAANTDYTCSGLYRFPFHETETLVVESGWVAGFISADPASTDPAGASPIPFIGSDVEGWLTGNGAAGVNNPIIEVGEPIIEGESGTDIDAFGFRDYSFNIEAEPGAVLPGLDPGGKVGDACEVRENSGIGAPLPLIDGGNVDGWSGVPVMYGSVIPAGETVDAVHYYVADNREFAVEDELYAMAPVIVKQEDGSAEDGEGIFSIWEVGPAHVPTEGGEQVVEWGSAEIPDDGNLYHPAAVQWQSDFDNTDGGLISFATGGGEGMHFFDVDTTDFVPDEELGDLEPDFVLSDLTIHTSAVGGRAYQLTFDVGGSSGEPGDFDADGDFDDVDIDLLSEEIRNGGSGEKFDVSEDGSVNNADRNTWVKSIKKTWFGDANLDGEFNSSDLVDVFALGLFELDQPAGWAAGDWDGDGRFNSSDFVSAFQDGGFELGPLPQPLRFLNQRASPCC